jgi:hypothetical protein
MILVSPHYSTPKFPKRQAGPAVQRKGRPHQAMLAERFGLSVSNVKSIWAVGPGNTFSTVPELKVYESSKLIGGRRA